MSFFNNCTSWVSKNPKSTLAGAGFMILSSALGVWKYCKKNKVKTVNDITKTIQEGEIAIRKKRVDTECNIQEMVNNTICEVYKQATSITPDVKELKECLKATNEKLEAVQAELKATKEGLTQVSPPMAEDNPLQSTSCDAFKGRSSAELFNRPYTSTGGWILYGYMKAGLLNFLVASTSMGKSIIMDDIALAVDKGVRPVFLPDTCCASEKLDVFFYRLEDFPDEMAGKYGDGKVLQESGIAWFLPEDLSDKSLDAFIEHLKGLAATLKNNTAVFVDPATKLGGYKHSAFIKGAEEAMGIAKGKDVTLTIIASIHHDEIPDWKCLTSDIIKGGDIGIQQAGSVTALRRERTGNEYRYLHSLKEPKGNGTPFNGQVLVCKIVSEEIDDNNKNTYLQYVGIKPEVEARPVKPKVQSANTGTSATVTTVTPSVGTFPITASAPSVAATPKAAPNQKVTPEMEEKMKEMVAKGMKPGKIAKKVNVSEKTVRRYIKEWKKQAA